MGIVARGRLDLGRKREGAKNYDGAREGRCEISHGGEFNAGVLVHLAWMAGLLTKMQLRITDWSEKAG